MAAHVTKHNSRVASCDGKLRYETFTAVERVTRRLRKRHNATRVAYRCRYCGGWHLGGGER